jgi:hypothetical protein
LGEPLGIEVVDQPPQGDLLSFVARRVVTGAT